MENYQILVLDQLHFLFFVSLCNINVYFSKELMWIETNPERRGEGIVERSYLTSDFWLWFNGVFLNDWFLALHHTTCGNYNICLKLVFIRFMSFFLEYVSLLIHSFPNIFLLQKIILYNENAFVHCPLHQIIQLFLISQTSPTWYAKLLIQFFIKISLWFLISMHLNVSPINDLCSAV